MSSKINNLLLVFIFQGKLLLGMSCVEKAGKDLAGAIFAKWRLNLTFILGLNVLLQECFG